MRKLLFIALLCFPFTLQAVSTYDDFYGNSGTDGGALEADGVGNALGGAPPDPPDPPLAASDSWNCLVNINGWTPETNRCVDLTSETGPTLGGTAIDCDGFDGVNPNASKEYIFRDTVTEAELENTSYDRFYVCNTVTAANVQNINRDCTSETGGYCLIQNWNTNTFDSELHPANQQDTQRSRFTNLEFDETADNWRIKGITIDGGDNSTDGISVNGADDLVIHMVYFDTQPGGIEPSGSAVECVGPSTGLHIQYSQFDGWATQNATYTNLDTENIRLNNNCDNVSIWMNVIKDGGDNILVATDGAAEAVEDLYIDSNELYFDVNLASCDDGANEPADADDECLCGENNLDLEGGGISGSNGTIRRNIIHMGRPQASEIGGVGNEFDCGGTGDLNGALVNMHFNYGHVAFYANILMDFSAGIIAGNDGDAGLPGQADIAKNVFYDWDKYYSAAASNRRSVALVLNELDDSRVTQNTFIPVSTSIEYCIDFSNDSDIEGNLFWQDCLFTGSTTGSVKNNIFANGLTDTIGDTAEHELTVTANNITFYKNYILGGVNASGSTRCASCVNHRGDTFTLPIDTGLQLGGLVTLTDDAAKGPQ